METQKLLLKEAAIILTAIIFSWVVGYYYDIYYVLLYLYALLALIIFTPPLALVFMRIRQKKELNRLTLVIKVFLRLSLFLFILMFVGGIYFEIDPLFGSPFDNPFLSFPKNITYVISNLFTLDYWVSGDWLEWPGWLFIIVNRLLSAVAYAGAHYSPYLVMIALLSWAGFVNKKMELKKDCGQEIVQL